VTTTLQATLGIRHDVPLSEGARRMLALVAWLGLALLDVLDADRVRELLRDYDGAAGEADEYLDGALQYGTKALEEFRRVNELQGPRPSPSKDPWHIGG
jgi:glutaredoxin-related protein